MPECPYCGKWYRSNKALKQHITKAHTSRDFLGGRFLDPFKTDSLGAVQRRMERAARRMKRKKKSSPF